MNGQLEEHLRSIEDFVLVEDKIVTYKWISKALKVHTNTAKQLLYAFSKTKDADKLLTTYLIGGQNGESGSKFKLVTSKELEESKKGFGTITAEHIYSVQRSCSVTGSDLYNADKTYEITREDQKLSSIHGNDTIKIRELPKTISTFKEPAKPQVKVPPKKEEPTKNNFFKTNDKPSEKPKVEPLKPKQNTDEVKKEEKKASPIKKEQAKKGSPKKNDKKNAPVAKNGGIGAFFNRQNANATKKKEIKEKEDKEAKENIEKIVPEVVPEAETSKNEEVKESKEENPKNKVKTPVASQKSTQNKKKRKKKQLDQSKNKRRKRIVLASDSESSDEEMDCDDPDPVEEPMPEIPPPPDSDDEIIPVTPLVKGRKRIRKEVDRNFQDEDGFIVTKKEYVYESCSDDEVAPTPEKKPNENKPEKEQDKPSENKSPPDQKKGKAEKTEKPAKEDKPKKGKGKSTPPSNNKQKSIMSFFSKK